VAASHEGATGEGLKGGEENGDEESRALEHVDNEDSRVETSKDETTTTRPSAPQSTPLEGECTGQTSGGNSESTACETDRQTSTTSTSVPSAERSHPVAETTDPPRPSEDPADTTGDDERRPDGPTEPPDKPEGARGRRGEARVETRRSKASREVEGGAGDDDDEERRPGKPDEPSNEPVIEPRDPKDVQVEPGGETEAKRSEPATLESADAEIDGRVVGTRRDAQVKVESAQTRCTTSEGETVRTTARAQSVATDDENDQRNETVSEDVPEDPPDPDPPPDRLAKQHDEPPSVELEGERRSVASFDDGLTRGEADASGASEGVEDDGNLSMNLRNASEHERERSRRRNRDYSPKRAQYEQDPPGDKAVVSTASGLDEDPRNRPRKLCNTSERADEALEHRSREDSPGTAPDEPDEPGGETAVPGDAHSTQEGPRCKANGGGGETSAPRRDRGPGGRLGEQGKSGDVEEDRERQSDGNGDQECERRGGKDGATSGARRDSKRVETTPLAEHETDQHGRRKRRTADVPRPSTPHPMDHRHPTDQPNPPRRRGRLKTRSRRVSTPGRPTRSHGRVKAVSGGSDASYMMYMDRRWWRRVPAIRNAKTRPLESIEDERVHLDSATTSRAATYHIG
jgi:hypothetical protein